MTRIPFPLRRAQFDALASGWLTLGATNVSLWSPDESLGRWPTNSPQQAHDLAAPICIGGRTIGEVRVTGFQGFNAQTQLAVQAELIAQLTILETELEHARKIQTGFFPAQMPSIHGLDLFAESRSAWHVGGDYFDFLVHTPQEFTFAVGDVCNKGVSAALLMAVIHKVLHTGIKLLTNPLPKDILAYINTDMYDELSRASMFVTSFIGQFDTASRRLRYANAGHSPIIYCPAGKPAQLLQADNVPLGVLRQSSYIDQEMILGVGDLLIVATDGLVEMRELSGEQFGYQRLVQRIEQMREEPAPVIGHALFDILDQFGNQQRPEDDQTLLIMRGVD